MRAYFQSGLYLDGLIYGGNLQFLLYCFTLYLRAISKYKPPPGGGGAIFGGAIEQKVFCVMSLGAYNWRGLYMYVEGLIFRILRYMPTLPDMALISRVYLGVRT